jgi:glycosyltransferase involved in cell wall biosynthesis
MLNVSLVTLGSPDQLTGGYLYHRRMADAAAAHGARVEFVPAKLTRNSLRSDADVVLVDSIAAAVVAPWVARRRRDRPLAAILHQPPGGIDHGVARRLVQGRLDRMLYRRCGVLIAASTALRDELVGDHGLPAARITVIPPGRDVAPTPPPSELRDLRAGRRAAFLSVGNWVERKGTIELLDAFSRLDADLATLHLVGRDDAEPGYASRVRDRLARPDLDGRVVIHGAVSREAVAVLYASADVFVLPSLVEPYGTVYGEAMACGLPVVGWRAGNLPNLAQHGRDGIVLEPGDIAGLADALGRLAIDERWRRQLGDAARVRARALPTWAETADELFSLLTELASHDG